MKFSPKITKKTMMNVGIAVVVVLAVVAVVNYMTRSSNELAVLSEPEPHSDCTGEACSKESYSEQTDCVEDGSCVISSSEDPLIVAPMRDSYRESYKEYTKTE